MPSKMATSLHWRTHSARTNYEVFMKGVANSSLITVYTVKYLVLSAMCDNNITHSTNNYQLS